MSDTPKKFGPFSLSVVRALSRKLDELDISYEVSEDRSLLAQTEASWKKSEGSHQPRGPSYDPAFLFLDLDPKTAAGHEATLLELGLAEVEEEPDFSKEEYVCPDCKRVVSHEAGFCPKHRRMLVRWSEYVAAKNDSPASKERLLAWVILLLLGGLVAWVKLHSN